MIQKIILAFIILNFELVNAVDKEFQELTNPKKCGVQRRDTTIEHGELDRAVISIPFYGAAVYQMLQVCPQLNSTELLAGLVAGWFLADYVSGVIHAIDDMLVYRTFTDKAMPVEKFIRRNDLLLDFPEKDDEDDHHRNPTMFTKKSY